MARLNSIDIDTGGTFTDGVFHQNGKVVTAKVDTTPHDPVKCFLECIEMGAGLLGTDLPALLRDTQIVRYSTTAATNTIIQKRGAKLGLIVTEGAEDDVYAGKGDGKSPIWRYLDPALVAGVRERVNEQGHLEIPLDSEGFRTATERLLDGGARLLVVVFSHSPLNPANELGAKEIFEQWFPTYYLGTPVLLLSHQITARGTDAERLNTAVVSGYLHRGLLGYLYRCDDALRRHGFRHPLLVVHSTGGLARVAKTKALNTYNSGPTAGVYGAARLSRRYGLDHVVTMDMGGTSTDIAFVEKGEVRLSFHAEIDNIRLGLPMVDVVGLGGGGGSIVTVENGTLRVGPESAGAVPGPACYELGNEAATVTDADVVLGLIAPDNFLGGRRSIKLERARKAIEQTVAKPLGLGIDESALRVRKVLAEGLANAIRVEAANRSFPIEKAILFAFGGAGPVHAADIAESAGMSTFYVFPESPVFSAAGLSAMNIEHYYERRIRPQAGDDFTRLLEHVGRELRVRAERDIRGEGFDPAAARFQFLLEGLDGNEVELDTMNPPPDLVQGMSDGILRLTATLLTSAEEGMESSIGAPQLGDRPAGQREIGWIDGRQMTLAGFLSQVPAGEAVSGPAVIETEETTCVIPRGWTAEKDDRGTLRVHRVTTRG